MNSQHRVCILPQGDFSEQPDGGYWPQDKQQGSIPLLRSVVSESPVLGGLNGTVKYYNFFLIQQILFLISKSLISKILLFFIYFIMYLFKITHV